MLRTGRSEVACTFVGTPDVGGIVSPIAVDEVFISGVPVKSVCVDTDGVSTCGSGGCVANGSGAAVADGIISKRGAPVRGPSVGTGVRTSKGSDVSGTGVGTCIGTGTGTAVVGDRDSNRGAPVEGTCVGVSVLGTGGSDVAGSCVGTRVLERVGATVVGVDGSSRRGDSVEFACVCIAVGTTDAIGTDDDGCVTSYTGLGEGRTVNGDGVGTDIRSHGGDECDQRVNFGHADETKRCKANSVLW